MFPPIGRKPRAGSPTGWLTAGRPAARRWDFGEKEGEGRSPDRTLVGRTDGRGNGGRRPIAGRRERSNGGIRVPSNKFTLCLRRSNCPNRMQNYFDYVKVSLQYLFKIII